MCIHTDCGTDVLMCHMLNGDPGWIQPQTRLDSTPNTSPCFSVFPSKWIINVFHSKWIINETVLEPAQGDAFWDTPGGFLPISGPRPFQPGVEIVMLVSIFPLVHWLYDSIVIFSPPVCSRNGTLIYKCPLSIFVADLINLLPTALKDELWAWIYEHRDFLKCSNWTECFLWYAFATLCLFGEKSKQNGWKLVT